MRLRAASCAQRRRAVVDDFNSCAGGSVAEMTYIVYGSGFQPNQSLVVRQTGAATWDAVASANENGAFRLDSPRSPADHRRSYGHGLRRTNIGQRGNHVDVDDPGYTFRIGARSRASLVRRRGGHSPLPQGTAPSITLGVAPVRRADPD